LQGVPIATMNGLSVSALMWARASGRAGAVIVEACLALVVVVALHRTGLVVPTSSPGRESGTVRTSG